MIAVSPQIFRAAIAYSHVRLAGGVKVNNPQPPAPAPAGFLTVSGHGAIVLEYRVDGGETIARKVVMKSGEAFWLRADIAMQAQASLDAEAADHARVVEEVRAWINATDQANAAKRGQTVEAYRRERAAQMNRQVMKSGVNSIGIR